MGTYKQIFYQIVFSTRHRTPAICETHEAELYKYIWGITNEKKCRLYRINSMKYIRNQKQHHQRETFGDEYKRLLLEQGIEFDEKYLF